jgi:hypothetical protein
MKPGVNDPQRNNLGFQMNPVSKNKKKWFVMFCPLWLILLDSISKAKFHLCEQHLIVHILMNIK